LTPRSDARSPSAGPTPATDTDTEAGDLPPRVRSIAHLLDDAIPIPGTGRSFGVDPIVSLLPVGGDALSAVASVYIIVEGFNVGVTRGTVFRMLFNVAVDASVGSLPVLGDLFDATWKANVRNIELLEQSDPEPGSEAGWGFLLVALAGFLVAVLLAIALVGIILLSVAGAIIGALPI
jgi:hypothetical protein